MLSTDTGYGVKGLMIRRGKVLLLEKHDTGYDLPGGRLEIGEDSRMVSIGKSVKKLDYLRSKLPIVSYLGLSSTAQASRSRELRGCVISTEAQFP